MIKFQTNVSDRNGVEQMSYLRYILPSTILTNLSQQFLPRILNTVSSHGFAKFCDRREIRIYISKGFGLSSAKAERVPKGGSRVSVFRKGYRVVDGRCTSE